MGPAGSGWTRVHTVVLVAFVALLASCSGERAGGGFTANEDAGATADASASAHEPSTSSEARLVVATATTLAARDPNLAERLEASRGAWQLKGPSLASAGWRSGGVGSVGARLPSRAGGAIRAGLGQSERYTVTLTPEGARDGVVEQVEGRAVYRDAYPATDVVFVASAARVEWMYLLRDDSAPSRFVYALALPAGLPAAKLEESGQVAFVDANGEARLRMPVPYAVDARGERREAKLEIEAGRLVVSAETAGLAYPVLLDPAVEIAVWEQRSPASSPPAHSNSAMAYDSARGVTVLFGGKDASYASLGDTWEWDGSTWTQVATAGPSPRSAHAMAYDSARAVTVLLGGYDPAAGQYEGDTWEWDGAVWTQVATMFPGRAEHAMAYDSVRGKVVLFGGYSAYKAVGDTWEWDGSNWAQVATTGPSARRRSAMAYDSARGVTVLFGGLDASVAPLGDTWQWDGSSWTQVATTGPSARYGHAMAYDRARERTIVVGGTSGAGRPTDTWEWDGSSWTQVATTGLSPRVDSTMAYDSARGETVAFGGWIDGAQAGNDTWEYHTRGGACSCPGGGNCASTDCDTGYCVDGVCCEGSSLATTSPPNCATCARCDSAANAGVCDPVTNAQDADSCSGASSCGPTGLCGLPNGQACTSGVTSCSSGNCVDGFCCDTPCAGGCDACNAADLGWSGGVDGTCAIAPAGVAGSPSCSPYVCDGTKAGCPNPCAHDSDCIAGYYCNAAGSCVVQEGAGASCNQAAGKDCWEAGCRECASGSCKDGYCCATACAGPCQTCAATPGTCTPVTSGDDTPECAGANTCDASGACKKKNGETCLGGASDCASGLCAQARCCNEACASGCTSCNLPGSLGTCTPMPAGANTTACYPYLCGGGTDCPTSCASDDGCSSSYYCNASGKCVKRVPDGGACIASDCKEAGCRMCNNDDPCVDGFCCDSECGEECERCDGEALGWPGATNGQCANAPAGYPPKDPPGCGAYTCPGTAPWCTGTTCTSDVYCAAGFYCDKTNHCSPGKGQGAACDVSAGVDCLVSGCRLCASGNCVDGFCCDSACDGSCDVCAKSLGASSDGTCSPAPAGTPGAPSCAPSLCNGVSATCGAGCLDDSSCAGSGYCDTTTGTCKGDQGPGGACTRASECLSGFCVDGVCCNEACAGLCQACSAALKQGGVSSGTCGLAKAGSDPHDDCPDDGALSCQRDGTCDGAGACRMYAAQTPCGAADCQSNAPATHACDGQGACLPALGADCAPNLCANGACGTGCATDGDCASGAWCDAGACKPKGKNGEPCAAKSACASNICADGVCCNAGCTGQCEACNEPGTEGTCTPVAGKPRGGRTACAAGTAENACAATSCDGTTRDQCAGFIGPTLSCRAASCTDGVATLEAKCDGKGACPAAQTTKCEPYVCQGAACGTACDSDVECSAKFRCDASKHDCVPRDTTTCSTADDHTQSNPDGTTTDCAPYGCVGNACKTDCNSIDDCAAPNVCDSTGKCVPPEVSAAADEGGCGCRVAGGGQQGRERGALILTALLAGFALTRRRRAAERTGR